MRLLSDAIDMVLCPAARANAMDPLLAIGCYWNGTGVSAESVSDQRETKRQADFLAGRRHFIKPVSSFRPTMKLDSGEEIYNDLFVPGYKMDADGLLHIHFPVPVGTPLSSTFLGRDWRLAALAYWIEPDRTDIRGVIITAMDATGRQVEERVEPEWLKTFGSIQFKDKAYEKPGPVCVRCSLNGKCRGLESFLETHSLGGPDADPTEKVYRQQKLFIERMELATKMETLKLRQEQADRELRKNCSDGNMNIGSEIIHLEGRKVKKWDYQRVKTLLISRGLWSDKYGTIVGSALQDDAEKFPRDVQAALKDACTETVTEPSITEAIAHGRQAVKRPNFRGLS